MSNLAIKVEKITKIFKIPEEKRDTLQEYFFNLLKPRKLRRLKVLDNISFELKEGEWLGVIGKNGSGKSTFLKIIAGIYQPDSGSVFVSGKMVPFLELGVGFNPNLTARENIFLNGAILGLSSQKIKRKFSEIVNFAEIGKFLDTPLKNFSSGMQVRLAFAIAIQAEADIYLLDEVLAVGDYIFQEKCHRVFEKLKQERKTVIFVSHSMTSVKKFCDRTIWIDKAKIKIDSDSKSVTEAYLCKQKNLDKKNKKTESNQSSLEIKKYLKESNNPKLIISYKPIENLPADWLNISFIGRGINIEPQKPLPFISGQFDLIICDFILEWLDYRMGLLFLKECQRILKTGKNLFIYTVDLAFSIKTYFDKNPAVKLAEAINRHAKVSGKENITRGELFNDGFYLWGQKSKYDQSMLEHSLLSNNFKNIKYFDFSKIKYFGYRDFDAKWTKQAVLACTAKK